MKLKKINHKNKREISGGASIMGMVSMLIAASNVVSVIVDIVTSAQKQNFVPPDIGNRRNSLTESEMLKRQQMARYSSKSENNITYW